jgi:hypothetical protein
MQVHGGGQIKTVPINRIGHAALEAIHPLTHENVNFHGGCFECPFILRRAIQGHPYELLKSLSLMGLITIVKFFHHALINS